MNLPEPKWYKLYIFNKEGVHSGGQIVYPDFLKWALSNNIAQAKETGHKILLTDEEDNCVFHMENCKIIFPNPSDN